MKMLLLYRVNYSIKMKLLSQQIIPYNYRYMATMVLIIMSFDMEFELQQ